MNTLILPVLFLFSVFEATLAQTLQNPGNCSVFNWDKQPAYVAEDTPRRVSGAVTCGQNSQNRSCALTARGDDVFEFSSNVSAFYGLSDTTFTSTITAAVGNDTLAPFFNSSVIAVIDQTRMIQPGESAYLNFTALKFCYTGTSSNCTGDVTDGTAVEVCAPLWHDDRTSTALAIMDGEYTVVNVSAADVGKYADPYQNQVRGGDEGVAGRMTSVSTGVLVAAVGFAVVFFA